METMSIESAQFCADWHIRNSEFFPKPVNFRSATQFIPLPSPTLEALQYPSWFAAVNLLFFQWLWRQIIKHNRIIYFDKGRKPHSIPDLEMNKRRSACRLLADEFAQLEIEGSPNATRDIMRKAFNAHMDAIPAENPVGATTT